MDSAPAPPLTDRPPPPGPPPPGPAPHAPKARWALLHSAWGTTLAAALVLPLAAAALVWGLLGTTAGSAWLLARLPGLEISGVRGALLGPELAADRLTWQGSGAVAGITVEALEIEGLAWRWWLRAGVLAGVDADSVRARRLTLRTGPSSPEPLQLPASLRLPVEARVARIAVDELLVDDQEPMRKLAGRLEVGAGEGQRHVVELSSLQRGPVQASGRATIAADPPFVVDASMDAGGDARPPWRAQVLAQGALEAIDLHATLRGEPLAGRPPATLDARVQLRPFAPWPLGRLTLQTESLNLAALVAGAPTTRLSGRALIDSTGTTAAVQARVDLDNAAPGPWSAGRLPLQRAALQLSVVPAQVDRLELSTFELRFADGARPAGTVRGSGAWDARRATLSLRVDQLQPRLLDARAPAMVLSGPIALALTGLPPPDPRATRPAAEGAPGLAAEFSGRLEGPVEGSPRPVALAVQGRASGARIQLERVQAVSGSASAQFDADLRRLAARRAGAAPQWQLTSGGRVDGFDPALWLPGLEGSAWRRGPHRLNGHWKVDLQLPASATRLPPLQLLQTLQGSGRLDITDSRLAGVPLQATLQLGQQLGAPPDERNRAQGEIRLGGNRLRIDGRGNPAGSGENDRLTVELDAPQLADLGPLVGLAAAIDPEFARWAPTAGRADGRLKVEGRWPDLFTEGQLKVEQLKAGPAALDRADLGWRLYSGRDQPAALKLDASGVGWGGARLAWVAAELDGRLSAHRIRIDAAAPARPPEALERALGLATLAGTRLQLEGAGSWERERGIGVAGEGSRGWRGGVERLAVGHWDGRGDRRSPADGSWFEARGLRGQVRLDAEWRLLLLQADAGRAMLAGGVPLRWNEVSYVARERGPAFTLQAEAGPAPVLPFLQRLQPGVAWSGDLRVSAVADIRAGERFDADIRLERQSGDLQVTESGLTQALGLTDVSLAFSAHDGFWRFTPLLAGRSVGTFTGSVSTRSGAERRWPEPQAPIEGALHVAVPDIAIWSGWVPPGWRLQGDVSATALIAGRFGAPEYTGELRADGVSVRNLLQGVAITDGRMRVALNGETARIEYFSVRGGDGTLTAEGQATFGERPTVSLRAQAQQFRALGRVDRLVVASGDATLQLAPDRVRLDGSLKVDQGLFDLGARDAPTLDDDVLVLRDGATPGDGPGVSPPRGLRNALVALDIDLGDSLRLRGRGLDALLKGQLRITTPGGRLAVEGSVRTANGTYAAYGQRLEIERGVVSFRGPIDSPELDILALRPNTDIPVGVTITGTTLNPRIRLFSDPEMSDSEKLSWLMLGRGSEGLGRNDAALLQSAAMALVAGEGDAPTARLLGTFGIDQFSVSQTEGETRSTVVSVGKQLSRRWYVGYERSVNATTGTWQLIYRLAQRFTLRAQSGDDNSLDLIWTWRFDRVPLNVPATAPTR